MQVLNLIVAATVFILVVSALRPPLNHAPAAFRPPWFPVMIVTELAPLLLIVTVVMLAGGMAIGATDGAVGAVAVWLYGLSIVGFVWMIVVSLRTASSFAEAGAVVDAGRPKRSLDLVAAVIPNPYRTPTDVDVAGGIEYSDGYRLDIYRSTHQDRTEPMPVIMHIHGGSWSGGNRAQQARPLLHHFAQSGWASVSIDYPLVPEATFPEPLVGVHRALAWIRDNAHEQGFDRSRIVVTGGSSGAHLASLAALTDDHPTWGMQGVHPPLAGAITFYGVYDLLDRHDIRDEWPIVSRGLIKADRLRDPDKFANASPIDHVTNNAPPFIVVHGVHDSLVPAAESRHFVDALTAVSTSPAVFVPLTGASHAFDAVPSIRTQLTIRSVVAVADAMAGD